MYRTGHAGRQVADMEKDHVTQYPARVLAGPAQAVDQVDESVRSLVDRMVDLMFEHKGIGFAAPQAGVPLRLFIVSLDGTREHLKVFINPTLTPAGELEAKEEGCLSVPGIYPTIRRYKTCEVTATDLEGKTFTETAEGLYARCLQHEYDHIEGITIVSRMGQVARMAHRRQLKRLEEAAGEDRLSR